MPQMPASGLTINDGATTPVAVSYTPEKVGSDLTILVDRRLTSRDQQPSVTLEFNRPQNGRKTYKVIKKVAYPIVRDVNGVNTVIDIARTESTFVLPPTMSEQERKHIRALAANAEDETNIKKFVESLEPFWG